MATVPALPRYHRPHASRMGRLWLGAAVSASLAIAVPGLVPSQAPSSGALPLTSGPKVPAAGHETLASAPAALRQAVEPLLRTDKPARMTALFSSSGPRLATTSGTWALGLGSIGRPGALLAVPRSEPSRHGNETLYRSNGLTEWFKDDSGGTEQGFTITKRPSGPGPLVISLAVTGLTARYSTTGALVLRQGKRAVLSYSGLEVTDARGSAVPARLVPDGSSLRIVVNDTRAVFPISIDPTWSQEPELTASGGAPGDEFGMAVSISGTTALVGAPLHTVGSHPSQGAAYVFTYSGSTWSQQAELTASGGTSGDDFGTSVSISGTTAVVGAIYGDSEQGAAYVFTGSGGTWAQQAELTASNGGAFSFFGGSVSISGTTVLVGAPQQEVGSHPLQGAAYVFNYAGSAWSQQAELTASDGEISDEFGNSVSLSGTTALVGATYAEAYQGAAYVFTNSGSNWSQQAELSASDAATYDNFGDSVSISGTTALVGSDASNVGANVGQGAAYVFAYASSAWSQQAELTAADGEGYDGFGTSVALSGTTALVGAAYSNSFQGATYGFTYAGSTWSQQAELTAADGEASDFFGYSVSLSGANALIGAYEHPVGSNARQGAAYAFQGSSAPIVSSVSPSAGPLTGATTVDVSGTGFVVGNTTASFGGTATTISCTSTTTCSATSPAGTPGTVDITLTTPGGTSATSAADQFSYDAVPVVGSVNPAAGPLTGTTPVAITGTGFVVGATTGFFGTTVATISCTSTTACSATAPPAGAGTVDITLTTPGGTSAISSTDQYTYDAAPIVTLVRPAAGPLTGTTTVAITGTGFVVGGTSAHFGTSAATISCTSTTTCSGTSPAEGVGTVDITVATPGGTSATSAADQYTYDAGPVVTLVSPASGPAAGGTVVSITGTGLAGIASAAAINFGTSHPSIYTVISATSVSATAPAHSPGVVDITVVTPGGTSATSPADQFTYHAAPVVSAVSPADGLPAGGAVITVTGTGFSGASAVDFGPTAGGSLTVVSGTSLTVVSPAELAGVVDITVTGPGGTSATGPADQFSYDGRPVVSAVSPAAGPVAGGTVVSVTGTGFVVGPTTARFGTTAATTIDCTSPTSCTVTSPAGTAGLVDITLSTIGGTSVTSSADQFSYEAPPAPVAAPSSATGPTISALGVNAGPASGGTSVRITGTNFVVGSTTVSFGTTAGTLVCSSTTSCTATSPAHPAGTVDVSVSTPAGTSALGSTDRFSFTAEGPAVPPVAPVPSAPLPGYWTVTGAGRVRAGGSARDHGSVKNEVGAVVGLAAVPAGTGYWAVTAAGRVYAYGSACYHGSVKSPVGGIVGIASTPTGTGYWAVSSDGRVYSFGSARYQGGIDKTSVPVVGIAASPTGTGYWLVTASGRVYAFGSARSYGSADRPAGAVVGIAASPTGRGYWLVTRPGRVYAFGSAHYYGGEPESRPAAVSGITSAPGGTGYWLAGTDGSVYGFGSAASSAATSKAAATVVGIAGA